MSTLLTNIRQLYQVRTASPAALRGEAMQTVPFLENAFLFIQDGIIQDFGLMTELSKNRHADRIVDCEGCMVLPTFCDSHTHSVFAASREKEFEQRIKGISYQEIAESGGGILNSAKRLQAMSETELFDLALARLQEAERNGTGAIEIKSGYGLTLESELKMLRVIKKLREHSPLTIKSTFLGAHSVPLEYKNNRQGYIDLIINEMLPQIAHEGLADYIDVFCEKIAFSAAETEEILAAGSRYGLKPKIHTNQFYSIGGIETALRYDAVSVDHLEVLTEEEIALLANSDTIATLLPSAPFFLNDTHRPPARQLLDNNVLVALASDFNPGTSPSSRMALVWSLACIQLRMTPEEALNALTLNAAVAMEIANTHGSITKGKQGSVIVTKPNLPSLAYLPYAFGSDWIQEVII